MILSNMDLLEIAILGYLVERMPKQDPDNKYEWPPSLTIASFCKLFPQTLKSTVYRQFNKLRQDGMITIKVRRMTTSRRPYGIYVATKRGVDYYNITSKYLYDLELAGFISPVTPTPAATHLKVEQGTGETPEVHCTPNGLGGTLGMN
jgi:hypothetical protein